MQEQQDLVLFARHAFGSGGHRFCHVLEQYMREVLLAIEWLFAFVAEVIVCGSKGAGCLMFSATATDCVADERQYR